jgi:ferredoxin--NADP+ reductase/benzoate/toluate 1,2-dioxygenase reductase subunit
MIEISRRLSGAGPRATRLHAVIGVRDLSPTAFVLRFSRDGLEFHAGQWINLGLPRSREQREYSVYSSPSDDFLEVLVKEIPDGALSPLLRRQKPGDSVEADGPHGAFTLVEGTREPARFLFCATGTGISPFHCFVRGSPGIDYTLLHGTRTESELYESATYAAERFVPCITGAPARSDAYAGRLTAWLREHPVEPGRYCYLCGNSDMIYEAYMILKEYKVPRSHIFAEVYF